MNTKAPEELREAIAKAAHICHEFGGRADSDQQRQTRERFYDGELYMFEGISVAQEDEEGSHRPIKARWREIADAALAVIEARYPGCWETLERAKAADDFAARRMNE